MRKIAAILLMLAVAGCASYGPVVGPVVNSNYNPITRERLYAAEASYNVAQQALLAYCGQGLRQCPRSKATIKVSSRKVNTAFVAARKCLRDTPDTGDCISGIENAVSVFRNDVARATGATQ